MTPRELEDVLPDKEKDSSLSDSPFLDPTARVVGKVTMGKRCGLFPGVQVRGEESSVNIGDDSIIMNDAVIEGTEEHEANIEKEAFISPGARLEGCDIGEGSLVSIDAVVMEGAKIGENAIVGRNAIVPEGMEVPDNSLVLGQPADVVRDVAEEDLEEIDELRREMTWKREEFLIMQERGERFDVYDEPKRPDEIRQENEMLNDSEISGERDLEKMKKKLKEKLDEEANF